MPMPQRVQYSDAIEPLVQFIEDTPPAEILDRTLDKLRAGVPIQTMLTAAALAVTRSTEMPPGHHGGPLHPLAGLYAKTLQDRLVKELRLHGISTIGAGNELLPGFLADYNARFGKEPHNPKPAKPEPNRIR